MATAAPEVPVLARDLAFERLYRRHVKDVYRYSLALLRDPADAEDVTQTTFMNAYRAIKRGEQPRKPQNWLIKIAHNAARTRYARSARRVKEVPLEEHLDTIPMPDDEQPDLREVLDALGRLPLNQRAALVMRELEGRSYAEIADTIGVSVPAVETLIFRARRSLRLNASAVRVLGLVPLPSSLAQLFDGGAVIAGGGAALGSGFLLKVAVAVVAGALATGVAGGGHGRDARAASATEHVATPTWSAGLGAVTRLARGPAVAAVDAGNSVRAQARGAPRPGIASHRPIENGDVAEAGSSLVGSDASTSPTASSRPPAPSRPDPVQQVTSVVQTVTEGLPPLPVAVPPLPSAPTVPPLPPVPLPGLP